MPPHLRYYFMFEWKWFGIVTSAFNLLSIITIAIWIWFAVEHTYLVGGDKLLSENINLLPNVWLTFSACVGVAITPKLFSIGARYYYARNRKRWS